MPSSSLLSDYLRSALGVIGAKEKAVGLGAPQKVTITPGLSESEVQRIQSEFACVFPPDLRALLVLGVPVGAGFPDWRSESRAAIRERLRDPLDGVLFDVENGFWYPSWGTKPSQMSDALTLARTRMEDAPVLVPIYSHRYMPVSPAEDGNPVFSVVQTDVIYYGNDLADYLGAEFDVPFPPWARLTPKRIRFWSDLVDINNERPGQAS